MKLSDLTAIIDLAKDNPLQTILVVIGLVIGTVLITAANEIGKKIVAGPRAVRRVGFVAVSFVGIIAVSAWLSSDKTDAPCPEPTIDSIFGGECK